MWKNVLITTGHDAYEADRRWANAFLSILKKIKSPPLCKWSDLLWCVHYALLTEERTRVCPVAYLEEVHRAAKLNCGTYRDSQFAKPFAYENKRKVPQNQNFIDFAIWINHLGYFRSKAPTLTLNELEHAAEWRNLDKDIETIHSWAGEDMLRETMGWISNKQILTDRDDLPAAWATDQSTDTQRPVGFEYVRDKAKVEQELDSALKAKKKEKSKLKWSRAKSRVFG